MTVNVLHAARTVADLGARSVVAAQARLDSQILPRIDGVAESLCRSAILQARCDLANTAACRWGLLLYATTTGGRRVNISPAGQILLPTPWSRRRHAAYGLSDADSRVLGAWVRARLAELPPRFRALVFDGAESRWYLSGKYAPATPEGFAGWWHEHMLLTPDGWLNAAPGAGLQRGQPRGKRRG